MQIDSLVQGCSISSALAMEILQSCSKPSMFPSDRTAAAQKELAIKKND